MKSCFRKLPNVLRRRVLGSVAGGAIFLCVFIASWIGTGRLMVSIPLLAMALFFLGAADGWYIRAATGKYWRLREFVQAWNARKYSGRAGVSLS